MQDRPIGVFDSGIGGLTVFHEIIQILPHEDVIYLGDTARVPYGTKSAATVTRYAHQNVRLLLERNVKMVVVACNTASAFALPELQRKYEIPIVGVIEPGVKGALKMTRSKRVGVIGTEGTIQSNAYPKALQNLEPGLWVTSAACPLFVPLVEEGRWEGEVAEKITREYLHEMMTQKIDTLILGCTHYPLLKKTLQKVVGEGVSLIDSAKETAREAALLLTEKKLMRQENKNPLREFLATDSPERFQRIGNLFLKGPLKNVHHVEI